MKKSLPYVLGFIVGIALVVIIFTIISIISKKKGKNLQYDERQQITRGKSFKAGFKAFFIAQALSMIFYALWNKPFINESLSIFISFIVLLIGAVTFAIHAIWNDAYFQVGEKKIFWSVLMLICIAINLIPVFMQLPIKIENGEIPQGLMNLSVAVFLFIIICTVWIKVLVENKSEKKRDDD